MKLLTLPLAVFAIGLALSAEAADVKLCKISGIATYIVPVPNSWSLQDCQVFAQFNGGNSAQALCLYEDPIGNALFLAGRQLQIGTAPTNDDLPSKYLTRNCGWKVK
jgi:hypothetical protein